MATSISTVSERLESAAAKAEAASELLHDFANGDAGSEVETESGPLPTLSKWVADANDTVDGEIGKMRIELNEHIDGEDPHSQYLLKADVPIATVAQMEAGAQAAPHRMSPYTVRAAANKAIDLKRPVDGTAAEIQAGAVSAPRTFAPSVIGAAINAAVSKSSAEDLPVGTHTFGYQRPLGGVWLDAPGVYLRSQYPALGAVTPGVPDLPIGYSSGVPYWSSSGSPQISIVNGGTDTLPSMAIGNGRYIARGVSSVLYISTTGLGGSFTIKAPAGIANDHTFILFEFGKFLLIPTNSSTNILNSSDGEAWASSAAIPAGIWTTYAKLNGALYLFGYLKTFCLKTTDGITWTQVALPFSKSHGQTYGSVTSTGNEILFANGALLWRTVDGVNWTSAPTPVSLQLVAFRNGVAILIANNASYITRDFINFTKTASNPPSLGPAWIKSTSYGVLACFGNQLWFYSEDGYWGLLNNASGAAQINPLIQSNVLMQMVANSSYTKTVISNYDFDTQFYLPTGPALPLGSPQKYYVKAS